MKYQKCINVKNSAENEKKGKDVNEKTNTK